MVKGGLAKVQAIGSDQIRAMGAFYLPYAGSLLAPGDREMLRTGQGDAIAKRALAQVYGVGGFADARLLMRDPFLLFPSFLTALPAPLSRLAPDEGRLSVKADGKIWVLISGEVAGDPYALDAQQRFVTELDSRIGALKQEQAGLTVKRTGAIFFAQQGAQSGLNETSTLGAISMIGTVLLLVGAFRRAAPC